MFVQDKPIQKDNIDTGLLRKSPILYINPPEATEETFLNRVLNAKEINYNYLVKMIKIAKNSKISWNISSEAHEFIAKKSEELVNKIKSTGKKGLEYASMMQWTIQNYLYKFSVILATYYEIHNLSVDEYSGELNVNITKEICVSASEDFEIVLKANFKHWQNFVTENPINLNRYEAIIIEELRKRKAFNKETAVIDNHSLMSELSKKYDKGETTFYNALSNLKEKDLVITDSIGKSESGKPNSMLWLKTI